MNDLMKDSDLKSIGKQIAAASPSLNDLSEEQLKEVASWYLKKKLTEEMETLVNASKVDQDKDIVLFLNQYDSPETRRAYIQAFKKLTAFCSRRQIDFISLNPALADEWILEERQSGRAPASVRKDVAAISSFYTFMERRYDFVRNPFRGTNARPKNKSSKKLEVPDKKDFYTVVESLPAPLNIIVKLMGLTGLRAGAFQDLNVYGNILRTYSKRKAVRQTVSPAVIKIFEDANITSSHPFKDWKAYRIENLLKYYTNKLYESGKIKAAYSAHDFRHYFAVTEYTATKDIYRVSKLLNHSSIQVTQTYLRSLNLDV